MYNATYMYRCSRCGKGTQVGMNVSHSHIRTKRRSLPNLHHFKVKSRGNVTREWYCTKCLRIVKKDLKTTSNEKKISFKETPKVEIKLPA